MKHPACSTRTARAAIEPGEVEPRRWHRPGRSLRSVVSLVAAVALVGGTLAASVLVVGSGASGAATPTLPNTMYVLNTTGSSLSSFAPGATGNVAPTSTVSGAGSTLLAPNSMAMDSSGNIWVANSGHSTVVEFTQAQLAATGAPTPTVTLAATAGSIDGPTSVAFDRAGDLWVSNAINSSVVEFTPSQLTASGAPTPTVTITSNGLVPASLSTPDSLTVDGSGNLWVGNSGNATVVKFTPAQIATTGTPTPTVTLTATAGSIATPGSLLFDHTGNLWVANTVAPGSVVEFSPTQLVASGAPVPKVTISSNVGNTNIDGPRGLTLDRFGNLWVSNALGNSITEFAPALLAVSGAPTPTASLTGGLTGLSGPAGVLVVPATGYTLSASDGGIFNYGGSGFFGSQGGAPLNKPIVGMAGSPDGLGYWLVASDGGIFNFGDAGFYGSHGSTPLNKPVVGMAATPDGKGYWLVASDGGIFTYGDATFSGSHGGSSLNQPIVGMAATGDGGGYWLVASDGGIFSYGDAGFFGSHGGSALNKPIVGMAASPDSGGYWLVASDGGIFTYGDAGFYGSSGSIALNKPIVGMAATSDGGGYWLVASDGGIFNYGDAGFYGSAGSIALNKPIVGMSGPFG
jgi:sugar lactone lactonase YvrE